MKLETKFAREWKATDMAEVGRVNLSFRNLADTEIRCPTLNGPENCFALTGTGSISLVDLSAVSVKNIKTGKTQVWVLNIKSWVWEEVDPPKSA